MTPPKSLATCCINWITYRFEGVTFRAKNDPGQEAHRRLETIAYAVFEGGRRGTRVYRPGARQCPSRARPAPVATHRHPMSAAPVERRDHFLAANGWESKTGNAIIGHGGRGTFCPGSEGRLSNLSLHQISRLSYARQPRIARPVNNPG